MLWPGRGGGLWLHQHHAWPYGQQVQVTGQDDLLSGAVRCVDSHEINLFFSRQPQKLQSIAFMGWYPAPMRGQRHHVRVQVVNQRCSMMGDPHCLPRPTRITTTCQLIHSKIVKTAFMRAGNGDSPGAAYLASSPLASGFYRNSMHVCHVVGDAANCKASSTSSPTS